MPIFCIIDPLARSILFAALAAAAATDGASLPACVELNASDFLQMFLGVPGPYKDVPFMTRRSGVLMVMRRCPLRLATTPPHASLPA